mmetsp:Transcript_14401/g.43006  ORF Transcript_14401/g.43006 Transcript_14401/m.43006 type:complete len:245 (-) Transcript_14401:299-1033(-)
MRERLGPRRRRVRRGRQQPLARRPRGAVPAVAGRHRRDEERHDQRHAVPRAAPEIAHVGERHRLAHGEPLLLRGRGPRARGARLAPVPGPLPRDGRGGADADLRQVAQLPREPDHSARARRARALFEIGGHAPGPDEARVLALPARVPQRAAAGGRPGRRVPVVVRAGPQELRRLPEAQLPLPAGRLPEAGGRADFEGAGGPVRVGARARRQGRLERAAAGPLRVPAGAVAGGLRPRAAFSPGV